MRRLFVWRRRRDKHAQERYLQRAQAVLSGDFSVLDEVVANLRRRILEDEAASKDRLLPAASRRVLRINLALLRELKLTHDPEKKQEKRWSISLPFAACWGRQTDRFHPELRAQLPALYTGIAPTSGCLYTWLAPIGVAAFAVASISMLSAPHPAEAGRSEPAVAAHFRAASQTAASEAESGDAPVTATGVAAVVYLPNQTVDQGHSKVEANLSRDQRKITIRRKREVLVGDRLIWEHEHTTYFYCNSEWRQKLCDTYDQVPVPIPLSEE